ncbi:hypothetical protein MUK42_23484 [Musa troglodytarum]|uniref:Protein kinase domain-containing protein n=1 Tax=Musa troglodytarum TaxID=320322 RepID=A0A9E7GCN5_9LILI|nr:hypothetical protein MUK42_23484 [Musa troglodytarum]
MSPERFDSESYGGDYDPYAADVWSLWLGAPLDWAALMVVICFGEAARAVPEGAASSEFQDFLECCLQKESRKRWPVAELLGHPFVAAADRAESEKALRDLLHEDMDES